VVIAAAGSRLRVRASHEEYFRECARSRDRSPAAPFLFAKLACARFNLCTTGLRRAGAHSSQESAPSARVRGRQSRFATTATPLLVGRSPGKPNSAFHLENSAQGAPLKRLLYLCAVNTVVPSAFEPEAARCTPRSLDSPLLQHPPSTPGPLFLHTAPPPLTSPSAG